MRLKKTLLASLLVVTFCATGMTSASAATCSGTASKGSTWTLAAAGTCPLAQARIDRYVGGVLVIDRIVGPQGARSYVSATHGIGAGHAFRVKYGTWTNWTAI